MPRHAAPERPVPPIPTPRPVPVEPEKGYFLVISVMAMLCLTTVITAMSISGNSHDAGGVACAAIMCATLVLVVRYLRRSR
jgi:hypothetical protein